MKIKYKGGYEFGVVPHVGVFRKGQVVVVDDKVGEILLKSHEFEKVETRVPRKRYKPVIVTEEKDEVKEVK